MSIVGRYTESERLLRESVNRNSALTGILFWVVLRRNLIKRGEPPALDRGRHNLKQRQPSYKDILQAFKVVDFLPGTQCRENLVKYKRSRQYGHLLNNGALLLKTSQDRKQNTPANHQSHGQRGCISGHEHLLTTTNSHHKQTSAGKQGKAEKDASWSEKEGHPVQQKSRAVRKDRRSETQATVIYCVESSFLSLFHSHHLFTSFLQEN